jgi:DNA invertase Pin-like site-specific DNA recombinase
MSYFAEYEAKKISRRTKAGLERAREEGKQIGRPSKFDEHEEDLKAMLEDDLSKAEMKRRTGLAYNTVKKYIRRIEDER